MLELVEFQKLNRTYVQLVFQQSQHQCHFCQRIARLGNLDMRPATGMPLFVIKLPIAQAGWSYFSFLPFSFLPFSFLPFSFLPFVSLGIMECHGDGPDCDNCNSSSVLAGSLVFQLLARDSFSLISAKTDAKTSGSAQLWIACESDMARKWWKQVTQSHPMTTVIWGVTGYRWT